MRYATDDVRITGMAEVIAPADLIATLPVSDAASTLVFHERKHVANIIAGRDTRKLVIVGPCSIHDPAAAVEYAQRLQILRLRLSNELLVVMRVYFEKPRTTVGWKGLINDPGLDGTFDVSRGLTTARKLLVDLAELQLPAATEFLDPITPQYLGDLITWSAIGARTTESQVHRQLASGLSCPVGFKNGTNGSVQIAIDAVRSAAHSHIFLSVTKAGHSAIFSTAGNPDCHIILRGGGGRTNYTKDAISEACRQLQAAGLPPYVMVDASHGNSEKNHRKQIDVVNSIAQQILEGAPVVGVMIESHLVEGRQDTSAGRTLTYGQSITDACIGWADTERVLETLANAQAQGRR